MSAGSALKSGERRIAEGNGLELILPSCKKGIGSVIPDADSPDLIGASWRSRRAWPDDRGYFLEAAHRCGLAAAFPRDHGGLWRLQLPRTIKAFHYHLHQTDCWTPARGCFKSR
jgi:dTDP-4-dehydrorhamnose 3,5-epimerase